MIIVKGRVEINKKIFFPTFILMVLFSMHCSENEWRGRIYNEDGARVVENYGEGLWGDNINEIISFIKEISLGKESGEDYLMFHTDIDISVDLNLNIYVLDSGNHRFIKFDKNGNYVWSVGRKGQGPGELQRPLKIKINPQQEICILDGFFRVHIYDNQGKYKRTIRLENSTEDFQYINNQRIFVRTHILNQTGLAATINSNEFKIIEKFSVDYAYGPKISGGGNIGGDIKYIQNIIYMVLPDKYEIRKYDLNGKLLQKIRRDFKFEPPEVKRLERGFLISGKTKLGPCFLDKRGLLINEVFQIIGESEEDFELIFFLDFFNDKGKFLGSYKLPAWTKLIAIDSECKYYFVTLNPFPGIIRSALK